MKETIHEILVLIGGKENIQSVGHCMTRLRISLKEKEKANIDKIIQLEAVLNAQYKGGQLQIILGPEVGRYYKTLIDITSEIDEEEAKQQDSSSLVDRIAGSLSGIFIPAVAAISAAGLIKAILALLTSFGLVAMESDIYTVLNMLGDAPFYFLPVLLGFSTATKLKTNSYLGASLGAVLVYPTLVNGAAEGLASFDFLGLPIPYVSYTSTVLPIIFAVIVLKYVYQLLNRIIPAALELIVTVSLAFFITSIIMLVVLAPAGNYLGVYIATAFTWLFKVGGPFAGLVMCGLFAVTVMTGLAYGTFPLVFQNLATLGYDYIVLPFMVYSNVNQGIAALAASLKLKDKQQQSVAVGAGVTAVLGITEPAMYTVNLRYKKPFYAAMIGSAVAGFLSSLFSVKVFQMAGGGITALPAYASIDYKSNLIYALLSLAAGMVLTFVITFVWVKAEDMDEEASPLHPQPVLAANGKKLSISSVGTGAIVAISEVPDSTFADGIMGQGVAIDIQDGQIFSPFDGEVAAIFPTCHAIGLKSEAGVEVLIHIGVDTVRLGDDYFTGHVKNGDFVKKGQLLITFDYDKLKAANVYTPTIILITNTQDFEAIHVNQQPEIQTAHQLMEITV